MVRSLALFFDSGSNGYVEIPSLNVSQYYPVTYSMWVKALELPISEGFNFGALIGRNKRYVQSCGAFGVVNINSDLSLQIWRGGVFGGDPPLYPISADLLSEWRHLALTMNENQAWEIYVDGYIVASGIAEGEMSYSGSFRIGSVENDDGDGDLSWDGWIDDVGIWDRALTEEEVIQLYNAPQPVLGCTNIESCNYDAEANLDDGSCLSCDLFAERCLDGTIWSEELGGCVVAIPSDSNFDGCVQLNDLLDLLSAYGDCGAEESPWQCGDPLEYQGYDYETVQIGEQCWFAENLRAQNYRNGELIPSGLEDSAWQETSDGAVSVFGEGASGCNHFSPNGDACDEVWSLTEYGRLYNWYAVDDTRGLCPNEWHVPQDVEWQILEVALGMSQDEASTSGWRGTDQGRQLKSIYGWHSGLNGTNTSGFSGLPGGVRNINGYMSSAGIDCIWWSSSLVDSQAWYRYLSYAQEDILRTHGDHRLGHSVRCLKD